MGDLNYDALAAAVDDEDDDVDELEDPVVDEPDVVDADVVESDFFVSDEVLADVLEPESLELFVARESLR